MRLAWPKYPNTMAAVIDEPEDFSCSVFEKKFPRAPPRWYAKYSSNRAAIASHFHEQKSFKGQKLGRNLAGRFLLPVSNPNCRRKSKPDLPAEFRLTVVTRRHNEIPAEIVPLRYTRRDFSFFPFLFFSSPICSLTDFIPFRRKTKTRIDRSTVKRNTRASIHVMVYVTLR